MKKPSDYWKFLKEERGDNLTIFDVRFDTFLNLRNQKELMATVLTSQDSVNVVALTQDQKIILVEQFRFGTKEDTLELPGGFIDPGENHKTAAVRELLEETGYSGKNWKYLGYIGNNPAFMNSRIHHYLLKDAIQTTTPKLDEGENISIRTFTLKELKDLLHNNKITHPHTTSGLAMVFNIYDGINLS